MGYMPFCHFITWNLLVISEWKQFQSTFYIKKFVRRTSAVDHVEFIWFVQWPAVIFTVIQIMPSKHTQHKTHLKQQHRLFSICDSLQTTSLLLHIRVEFGYHADAVRSHVDELVWKQTAAVMLWDSNETQTEGWWRWWRVCTCVLHLGTSAVLIY